MGFSPFCKTNPEQPAPNPNPGRWELLSVTQFSGAYVLHVRYLDCINFEGEKVMVFRGEYVERDYLDPHFQEGANSPVARFRPDKEGLRLARLFAQNILLTAP